jgi:LysM repeat protein
VTQVAIAEAEDMGIQPTPTLFATRSATEGVCVPPPDWERYTVERGNTLFMIASAVGSSVGELRDANCLQNVDDILAGDVLLVPRLPTMPVGTIAPDPLLSDDASLAVEGCTHPGTQLTTPRPGERVNGVFTVFGTALVANFDYYKIEVRPDFAAPGVYNFYGRYDTPVADGALEQINTGLFENGLHWVRLTVVDTTGNFPQPCTIPVYFD